MPRPRASVRIRGFQARRAGRPAGAPYACWVAHLLGAEALHLEYPTRVIFEGVTLGIDEGSRIGVVGRNGDGKSTLMSLLAGTIEPDSGRVTRRRGITMGVLDQRDILPLDSIVSEVIVGDRDEHEWAGDARIRDVISGLATDIPWGSTIGDLSGGQRRRVALAALLVGEWDVLFLDEPTNHLDVEGVAWLAQHLKRRWSPNQGALVVVTHDRWFLDEVSTDTWEVHDGIVEPFEGGYAAYVLQRVERDRSASVSEAKRQNLMKKELAWLRRGAPARTAKPKFRIEAAETLIADEPPVRDKVSLSQMATSRLGKQVVDIIDVAVNYGSRPVLKDIEWRIAPGERTGILGVNGAGKSTLLKLVTGAVLPTTGRVTRGKTVKFAVLDQQLADLHEFANERVNTVVSRYRSSYVSGGKELTPGQLLERLGFTTPQLQTAVKDLSGGQKRRLQLLLILLDEPNVLILDEPTNDLDTDMLAAMEDLLDTWPGTLLVVSHDRYLLERVTDTQYAVLDGHMRHLPGGVDQYLALRKEATDGAGEATDRPTATQGSSVSVAAAAKASGLTGAEKRNAEKELASLDRRIKKAAAERASLLSEFTAHDPNDYSGLGALQKQVAAVEAKSEELEAAWLVVSEKLEG